MYYHKTAQTILITKTNTSRTKKKMPMSYIPEDIHLSKTALQITTGISLAILLVTWHIVQWMCYLFGCFSYMADCFFLKTLELVSSTLVDRGEWTCDIFQKAQQDIMLLAHDKVSLSLSLYLPCNPRTCAASIQSLFFFVGLDI